MRIAIVGAGIGGLAAAAFLHRAGLRATVYEQAGALREVGAGLVLSPNGVRLLRRLGQMPSFQQTAVAIDVGWQFRRWRDGAVLSSEDMRERCAALFGERSYFCHRADLLACLRAAVPAEALHLGARCLGVSQQAHGAQLVMADGSTEDADVVIGADGVHSVVRDAVVPTDAAQRAPQYSGMCAFRALVPAERAPAFAREPVHTLWLGPDHHLVHYPVSAGRFVNLVAFAPAGEFTSESWSTQGTVAELLAEFEGWDARLIELLQHAGTPGRWALIDRPPLPRWSQGRVALLGDAAHPMFPFFAQGAVQAIEDAAALAVCVAGLPADPERALAMYEQVRKPRADRVQALSHARKDINHLPDGPEQVLRDAQLSRGDALERSAWIYGHDAEAEGAHALAAAHGLPPWRR